MGKSAKKSVRTKKLVSEPRKGRSRPIWAILFFAFALMTFVAIWDFDTGQSRQTTTEPAKNLVGVIGAEGSFWAFYLIGIAAWLVPFYLLWIGIRFILQQGPHKRMGIMVATVVSILCASGLAGMLEVVGAARMQGGIFENQLSEGVGGIVGTSIGPLFLEPFIGPFGSFLLLLVGFSVGSIIVFTDNLGRFFEFLQDSWHGFLEGRADSKEARKQKKADRAEAKRLARESKKQARAQAKEDRAATRAAALEAKADGGGDGAKSPVKEIYYDGDEEPRKPTLLRNAPTPPPGIARADEKLRIKQGVEKSKEKPKPLPVMDEPEPPVGDPIIKPAAEKKPKFDPSMIKIISGEKTEKAVASIPERRGDYVFPTLDLLTEPVASEAAPQEDHAATMEALVRTLDEFGVKVIPGEIHTGPVITRYEVTPAAGVRVEKIVNLDKNIALGLKALSVRILAPVPGKGTVGIEVPNKIAQAVCMRDIVESKAWAESKAEIPVVLGKDVTGKPIVADLTKMPHVLIAGSTGSGKTVCINAVIASLLYHSGPQDLRFIMVDPKVVEMQVYNDLPHMLIPVVTEAKKVPGALKWLIAEMERRYQIFAAANVRNIAGFNAKLLKDKEEQAKADAMDAEMSAEERAAFSQIEVPRDDDALEIPKSKMPYIVCVIDELADLMMVAPADIETCIARLAQLARAAGIHLILATQRPSVNVITGVIKANLPSRISFKVASKVDSRTILDGGGAESLIGKGDMLFIPPGTSNLVRAQGAFVSDEEINAIVEFLKEKNAPPVFAQEVQKQIDSGGDDSILGTEDGDELLPDAIDVLKSTKRASTSMLQRRLRIGYNRAARIMEILEDRGIVGPDNGSSPREILVDLDSV